ncbi:MAG: hypothetical protein ACTSVU_03710 [Promethearchaeota archaeon]
MAKNDLLVIEREFWANITDLIKSKRKNIKIFRNKFKIAEDDRYERIIFTIQNKISEPEGLILPIILQDEDGSFQDDSGIRLSIIEGDRIRITESEFLLWKKDEKIEIPILDVPTLYIKSKSNGIPIQGILIDMHSNEIYQNSIEIAIKSARNIYLQKIIVGIIKELLEELLPGDEVSLKQARKIVQQELQSKYNKRISLENINYIENFFRLIGNNIEGFQFIRLKETIRCNSNNKDIDLNKELTKIDELFNDWEQNPNRNNKMN